MNNINAQFFVQRNNFTLDINLSLPSNGISALFGPSGSGKTTCLRAMAGLEQLPNSYFAVADCVWQDSQKGIFIPPHRREIGYVFQEPSLFEHLNVRENLNFGRKQIHAEKRKISFQTICELLGLNTLLDRPSSSLSGGECQRVAIARALLTSPKLLLMDEPLSALDNGLKQEILPYLENLQQRLNLPVIYVSHSADEVTRLADYLVLIEQGKKVDCGPIEKVIENKNCHKIFNYSQNNLLYGKIDNHTGSYLSEIRVDNFSLFIPKINLNVDKKVRCTINARDISLSRLRPIDNSTLNIITGSITKIEKNSEAEMNISIKISTQYTLISTITVYALQKLELKVTDCIWAEIKKITVL